MKIRLNILILILAATLDFLSCKPTGEKSEEETVAEVRTPVTVAEVSRGPISEYIELNAISAFLQKSYPKANANGYLENVNIKLGDYVKKGQILFTIKNKESQSLGNVVNALDTSFRFTGLNSIKAGDQGYITQLSHHDGDYVQDGEQLAVISDMNSFVFLLDLPYELRPVVMSQKTLELTLPDGEKLIGTIASSLPIIDAASQTQSIILKVNPPHPIPENLIAKVKVIKTFKTNSISIPKSAVLTNDTQSDFWVMKLIDSTTAVKVMVRKGIETNDRVEIIEPPFAPSDKVLITGNYGLPDTAKVQILQ